VLVDRSESMSKEGKWSATKDALSAFFKDPKTAGLAVALQGFPDGDGGQCEWPTYAAPDVKAATLQASVDDPQEKELLKYLNGTTPSGTVSPLYIALQGAFEWAKKHIDLNKGKVRPAVVVITDGIPEGCNEPVEKAKYDMLIGGALSALKVRTFVVAIKGGDLNLAKLNEIAAAGGTKAAYSVESVNINKELLAALDQIQFNPVACEFDIPMTTKPVEADHTNICYSSGGSSATALGTAGKMDAAACGQGASWYLDDPSAPKKVVLCPLACAKVQADPKASIRLVFGCKTQIN
jgi:hypothetical protein